MKVCHKCDRVYDDDTLSFCLMDGTRLVEGESLPTVAISGEATLVQHRAPSTSPMSHDPTGVQNLGAQTGALPQSQPQPLHLAIPKRRSKLPWIVLAALVMIGLVVFSGWLVMLNIRKGKAVSANQNRARQAQNLAKTPVPDLDGVDEVTPIDWSTAGYTFNTEPGKTYRFVCPAGGSESAIWGSDVYTGNSSVCTAAVHAGIIGMGNGGEITVEFRPGRALYGGTNRNGITSSPFGEYPTSFVVK